MLTLPSEAVLMGAAAHQAQVFIYDDKHKCVHQREIIIGTVINGRIQIRQGIAANELVVVAGAQFLHDGEAVSRLSGTTPIFEGV